MIPFVFGSVSIESRNGIQVRAIWNKSEMDHWSGIVTTVVRREGGYQHKSIKSKQKRTNTTIYKVQPIF